MAPMRIWHQGHIDTARVSSISAQKCHPSVPSSVTCQCCPAVPPVSAAQQYHLSVPSSVVHQCHPSMMPSSAADQCRLSVPPVGAISQCCLSVPIIATSSVLPICDASSMPISAAY
ncbi:unnamed protein product [Staurois parvus]|uniref:Uncharacterized protein n=1 Tax=Staurois parvus TaxID=386267 RepID=A0ABN9AHP4_9NEOB|nr:unnamed protein product [Staurois parvus]